MHHSSINSPTLSSQIALRVVELGAWPVCLHARVRPLPSYKLQLEFSHKQPGSWLTFSEGVARGFPISGCTCNVDESQSQCQPGEGTAVS